MTMKVAPMENGSETASLHMVHDLESHPLEHVADAQLSTMKKYGINSDEMFVVSKENIQRLVLSNKHCYSDMLSIYIVFCTFCTVLFNMNDTD